MGRRAAKVDINQKEIVNGLRDIPGCKVTDLSNVGMGCPDILAGYRGVNYLIEIKSEWAKKGKELTPAQERWHDEWTGQKAVVWSLGEAMEAIGFKEVVK
ncbi:MAG: hypothetical protein ABJ360_22450 [Roseobacter sp.]